MAEGVKSKNKIINKRNAKLAVVEALGLVAFTTIYDHREMTHHSLKAKKLMSIAGRIAAHNLGRKPRYWARTHISHHAARDANLLNILETADCLDWLAKNGNTANVPNQFNGLDPIADLTPAQIQTIGNSIRKAVADRYDRPTSYSQEELERLLDADKPRYFYPDKQHRSADELIRSGDRSIERLRSVLVDPHSPALHRLGLVGILYDNVPLFKANQKDVKAFEDIGEYQLGKDKADEKYFDKGVLGLSMFYLSNIILQIILDRDYSPSGLVSSVASGAAVATGVAQLYKLGGDATNGFGHMGASLLRALLDGKPQVKPDGTYTYNAKLLNLLTFDEVGGQDDHHNKPGKIAYTEQQGLNKLVDAPFGALLEAFSNKDTLFEPGDQFGHPEVVDDVYTLESQRDFIRPDEPLEAVLMLEAARVLTMAMST